MPLYLVRHRIRSLYASQDDLLKDWRALRQRARAEPRWKRSFYAAASERLTCEWEASSPEAIRACFLPAELEMAPIEEVEEVVAIDPAWLDELEAPEAAARGG